MALLTTSKSTLIVQKLANKSCFCSKAYFYFVKIKYGFLISKYTLSKEIKLVIPDDIREKYNDSLALLPNGKNTLVGYRDKLKALDTTMWNLTSPTALIIGDQGVGKSALVEQWGYERSLTNTPVCIVALNIEKLGELDDNIVVSRMRTLLEDMNIVKQATIEANGTDAFQMALWIDEIHKLNNYGKASQGDKGSSGAMNALKEDLARGVFPVIGATTKYEFAINIEPDLAFSRRLTKIRMQNPPKSTIKKIVQRRLDAWREQGEFVPICDDKNISKLIDYANAYMRDQAQPARTLVMLDKCIGICRQAQSVDPTKGFVLDLDVIVEAFHSEGYDINTDPNEVIIVIPPEIKEKYNDSLFPMKRGDNTLIGYTDQLDMLDSTMFRISEQMALLLGPAGSGKTALVEQWIYNRSLTSHPACVVGLNIERLGALPENVMISRMRDLLTDLKVIYEATKEANPGKPFQMALFIDEIHKLNSYGAVDSKIGSSAAMNALKEGLARNAFALIGATTADEYRRDIVPDTAFDRRFGKVIMEQPTLEMTVQILKRRLEVYKEQNDFVPDCADEMYEEMIHYADAFIRNIANPAKSLTILDGCIGLCRKQHNLNSSKGLKVTHETIVEAFLAEGYTIDTTTTPQHVIQVVNSQVLGQPLALDQLADVVRNSLYTTRNFKKPLMTALFVGSTGTGKTQTAKALAKAFYGRQDALLTLNGGDYATRESAVEAQHFIGDAMQTDKRQLVLLDEIEKSHPKVMDAYMRMIDEGIARDSNGIERSLNSTVIIATSNLGADLFSQLADTLRLHRQSNPNKLNPQLKKEWWRTKASIEKGLQSGNVGRDDGIKPEFLQRFSLLVPFMPLARKTIAMIAHMQLEVFCDDMANNGNYSITVQMPSAWSHDKWAIQMHSDETPYGGDDPISVMIAEDVIGPDASTYGARAIASYIDGTIKTQVIQLLDERVRNGLEINGAFRMEVNHASFISNSNEMPGIKVTYIPIEEL